MKAALACAAALAAAVAGSLLFGSEEGLGGRVRGFFDPVPHATAGDAPPAKAGLSPAAGGGSGGPLPSWRLKDRDGWVAYEAGDFPGAAAAWDAASAEAPPSGSLPLRARADRARLFRLLTEGAPSPGPGAAAAAEAEYRRPLDALPADDVSAWLEVASFAASRGLRHHLAFLYEQAYERRQAAGGDALAKRATAAIRRSKASGTPTPPDVLESVIRELPSSEAAEVAREETGAGIGGVAKRGEAAASGVDLEKLDEARTLAAKGDTEYRQALPGSKDVNVHRRAALNHYEKARAIYEALDNNRGTYGKKIQELNRNIAELHKDLPIGK